MYQHSDLYFIVNPALGIIKIGIAADVVGRRIGLEHACGVPLDVLRVVAGGAPFEKPLHEAFGRDRLRGEWFLPSDALVRLATGTADVGEYLKRVEPQTAVWRKERDDAIAVKRAAQEEASRAHREEIARIKAEEKRLKEKREATNAKARATKTANQRKEQAVIAARVEEGRQAWLKDGTRVTRIASQDAMKLAEQRRAVLAQRMRNASMIGVTPEA